MDNPEKSASAYAEESGVQAQVESLRFTINIALVLVLILAFSFNRYMWGLVMTERSELKIMKPNVTAMVAEYNKTTAPILNDFATRLVDFGMKNPDFMPILLKYGITATTNAAPAKSAAPVTAPAPKGPAPTNAAPAKK